MKPLSAKNMKALPRLTRKQRLKMTLRHKKVYGKMKTGLSEFANYDPTDIATDLEAKEHECCCIIHSGGHKPFSGQNEFNIWSDWEDKL